MSIHLQGLSSWVTCFKTSTLLPFVSSGEPFLGLSIFLGSFILFSFAVAGVWEKSWNNLFKMVTFA
jgi:hypothetical protein